MIVWALRRRVLLPANPTGGVRQVPDAERITGAIIPLAANHLTRSPATSTWLGKLEPSQGGLMNITSGEGAVGVKFGGDVRLELPGVYGVRDRCQRLLIMIGFLTSYMNC